MPDIDEVTDEIEETPDVDVTVIEAPEPEEVEAKFASVDVGDLHISGPAEMVESITAKYLKDHLDHNPHDPVHTATEVAGDAGELVGESAEGIAEAITPDIVEEQIRESVEGETVAVDVPPGPTDWLFRERGGR
jgi:hypothetical protein